MKAIKLVGCLGLALVWTLSVEAKDKAARGPHKDLEPQFDPVVAEAALKVKWSLSEEERRVIRTYVAHHVVSRGQGKKPKALPPGLAKKVAYGQELPPGWEKKCVPGEIMPVEVFEKCQPLPAELVIKLPPPPAPTITVTISGQVVRLIKATREILDVFNVHPH